MHTTQADAGADGMLSLTGASLAGKLAVQAQVQTLVLTGFPSRLLLAADPRDGNGTPAIASHAQPDGQMRKAAVR